MKEVLIIAYYTPPLGMSGVMRITKFAKFLPRFGWKVKILTVKPIAYYHYDYNLLNDLKDIPIFRSESLDPARILYFFQTKSNKIKIEPNKVSQFLNFLFFPDSKVLWIPFAYRLGCKLIEQSRPDVILASAPPFSALLVGLKLKQKYQIPLIADFRDPWPTGFVSPPQFMCAKIKRFRDQIINNSDQIIAVNYQTREKIECPQAVVIENGYDPEEFKIPAYPISGFNIVYTGNVWENFDLLKSVAEAIIDIKDVKIILVGSCDAKTLIELKKYKNIDYLGICSHSETIAIMKSASLLLYLSKPNQAVGIKLYEYFGANKPILGVALECNEAMRLIENHAIGIALPCEKKEIREAVMLAQDNKFPFQPKGIENYNRLNQTQKLSEIMNKLIKRKINS
ncbi:MAG: glycosyltransferase [candidate division WOR-3 bacterium]|nr:glycosyltransferase [candidate division WOR-3 bacterium]